MSLSIGSDMEESGIINTPSAVDAPPSRLRHPRPGPAKKPSPLYRSPLRLLLLMAAIIFLAEMTVMHLLRLLPPFSPDAEAILDAAILILLLAPTSYFLWMRPFLHHIRQRRRSEEEVRHLSRQLMLTTEEERRRLARDIHDEFGQAVATLQLDLERLQEDLRDEGSPRAEDCNHLKLALQRLGERVRNFSSALRPEILDHLGIAAALRRHFKEIAIHKPDLQIDFQAAGLKHRLPDEIEVTLYRLCQEAFNNILKHSGAGRAEVRLTYSHPRIILTVRDDGAGFDWKAYSEGPRGSGVGLPGMRERVESLGGIFNLSSVEGRGTVIRVEIPVMREEGNE